MNTTVNAYLENSFNISTTNKKCCTCVFTFEKYLQHSIVIASIILRLQQVNFIQYEQQVNKQLNLVFQNSAIGLKYCV